MKKTFELHFPNVKNKIADSKEDFVDLLVKNTKGSDVGYAGFTEKKFLKGVLKSFVFDEGQDFNSLTPINFQKDTFEEIANLILSKCKEVLEITEETTHVFIFPTYSIFVKESMGGVSGLTPYKNTMLIFVHVSGFMTKNLEYNLSHEYLHTIAYLYAQPKTLLDNLVAEGLAEHFSELITKHKSPVSSVTSSKAVEKIVPGITKNLTSTNPDYIKKVILGSDHYPMWAGYRIGYDIVDKYMTKNPHFSWQKAVQEKADLFLDRIKVVK